MNPELPEQEPSDSLTQRAETLIELGRPIEATKALHQVLAQGAEDEYWVLGLLAVAYSDAGDYEESLSWAARALEADPEHWWAHWLRACQLFNLGDRGEALAAAREAVRLDPENTEALATLARFQIASNDLDGAFETLENLRRLDADGHQTHDLFGHAALERLKGPEAALYFRRALAVQPESAQALFKLGVLLHYDLDTRDEARADAQVREGIDCLYRATLSDPVWALARFELLDALETLLDVKVIRIIQAMASLISVFLILGLLSSPWSPGNWLLGFIDWYLLREVLYCLRKSRASWRTLPPPIQEFWRRFGIGPVRRYPWV